jgi:hypothetical protein
VNGDELYLEIEYDGEVDKWPKENILPTLTGKKVSRDDAIAQIKKFVGDTTPYMVAYVNQFDTIYLYKLFGTGNEPFFWIPIDFASILFVLGKDPESYYCDDKNNFFKEIGIDAEKYSKHHALDDAKLLRETYLKLLEKSKL